MVVPLTSNLRAARWRLAIRIKPTRETGLSEPSILLVNQLRSVDRSRLSVAIGRLDAETIKQLKNALTQMLCI